MRAASIVLVIAALAAASCEDTGKIQGLEREKAALEAKVDTLEKKVTEIEASIPAVAKGGPALPAAAEAQESASCVADLEQCTKRLTRCEKDPFTGTKYLADEGAAKKDVAATGQAAD